MFKIKQTLNAAGGGGVPDTETLLVLKCMYSKLVPDQICSLVLYIPGILLI